MIDGFVPHYINLGINIRKSEAQLIVRDLLKLIWCSNAILLNHLDRVLDQE